MMSTRNNRKQQNQEEAENSSPMVQEERVASELEKQKVGEEGEQAENATLEKPKPLKRPRKPRKRARPLLEDEVDIFSDEERHGIHEDGQEEHLSIPEILPVLPLKDTVVYPFAVQPLGVGQERSIRLIDDVMRGNRLVVLVAQK
ncbi:MAG: LON peptidase substrate-binding domain-containing protein, partial [Ktedonobacteraceae bacterium]